MADAGLIFQAIPAAMADIEAIAKTRNNTAQNFKFRGIDDVYNALHEVLAKHKIFTVPEVVSRESSERETKTGSVLFYEKIRMKYVFYAADGSSVVAVVEGIAMDSGDKAGNKAMSVAHKYALLQVFCIPTEEDKDPDATTHEVKSQKAVNQPATTTAVITEKQRTRFFAIGTDAGKTVDEMRAIVGVFGFEHSRDITQDKYDAICAEAAKSRQREPGED
jgi:hypothetical protein